MQDLILFLVFESPGNLQNCSSSLAGYYCNEMNCPLCSQKKKSQPDAFCNCKMPLRKQCKLIKPIVTDSISK